MTKQQIGTIDTGDRVGYSSPGRDGYRIRVSGAVEKVNSDTVVIRWEDGTTTHWSRERISMLDLERAEVAKVETVTQGMLFDE